ncbi:hypothetical protein G6F42_022634 [Rhizopus arrhizus]|nr:hypothetical protein G6F42_022634 [Rhizopus arrhizus]
MYFNWPQAGTTRHIFENTNNNYTIYKCTAILNNRLPSIEAAISTLQQEMAEHQALRLGLRWREKGEASAGGFLKRLTTQQLTQRTLPTLSDLSSGSTYKSPMLRRNKLSIHFTLISILPQKQLFNDSHESLCAPFTLDDILVGLSRSPAHSSPGTTDRLPYQIVHILLFNHTAIAVIGLRVFNNDALLQGIFPASSWTQASLNWRPISLINTDAKTFTRLLNTRLMVVHFSDKISSIQQMGFIPNKRFIAEQGLQVQCMQTIATKSKLPSIALFS